MAHYQAKSTVPNCHHDRQRFLQGGEGSGRGRRLLLTCGRCPHRDAHLYERLPDQHLPATPPRSPPPDTEVWMPGKARFLSIVCRPWLEWSKMTTGIFLKIQGRKKSASLWGGQFSVGAKQGGLIFAPYSPSCLSHAQTDLYYRLGWRSVLCP